MTIAPATFTIRKPDLLNDDDPNSIAPAASRVFSVNVFESDGEFASNLKLIGRVFNAQAVQVQGTYDVQLYLDVDGTGTWAAYGSAFTNNPTQGAVSLLFGGLVNSSALGFFRVTNINASGGATMAFDCALNEPAPVLRSADGVPIIDASVVIPPTANLALENGGHLENIDTVVTEIDGFVKGIYDALPVNFAASHSTSLQSAQVLAASATAFSGVRSCAGTIDHTCPSGNYYLQLIDSPTSVTGGGAITLIAPEIPVTVTTGSPTYFSFADYIPPNSNGLKFTTGATLQLSSTMGTGTLVGAYLSAGGVAQ